MMIVSETPRLVLRQFTADDADALAVIHADPVVTEFIDGVTTPEQTCRRIATFLEDYERWGFSKWAVVLKSTGELIGRCGPVVESVEGTEEVELGYTLSRPHWGRGYATEAARAALHACASRWGHRRVVSLIDPLNARSRHVAERLGMRHERDVIWGGKPVQLHVVDASPD